MSIDSGALRVEDRGVRWAVVALVMAAASCAGWIDETVGSGDAASAADGSPIDGAAADAPPGTPDARPVDAPVAVEVDASVVVCPPPDPMDCSPGTGTGEADQCHDGPSCFLADVKSGVTWTVNNHPEWFGIGPNDCPLVVDVDAYMSSVVDRVLGAGHCAIRDPNDPNYEITVKHDNAFAENHRIRAASTGCARWGDAIYTGYCAPAWRISGAACVAAPGCAGSADRIFQARSRLARAAVAGTILDARNKTGDLPGPLN
jgi:hypothetical protein